MRIIALYKTFSGEEFVEASIESIYNSVSEIVMVHSNVSWSGEKGNTVLPVVQRWAEEKDKKNKIINLVGDFRDQNAQYNHGLSFIRRKLGFYDFVLLIDTDEVWDRDNLYRAGCALHRWKQQVLLVISRT